MWDIDDNVIINIVYSSKIQKKKKKLALAVYGVECKSMQKNNIRFIFATKYNVRTGYTIIILYNYILQNTSKKFKQI